MLRAFVLGLGAASMLCGAIALAFGVLPTAFIFAFWGVVLAVGIVFERVIYKRVEDKAPGAGWVRTPERFVDEQTGRPVTVYIEPATGERAYVQE